MELGVETEKTSALEVLGLKTEDGARSVRPQSAERGETRRSVCALL